jgi:hypothetical protein
MKYHKHGKMRYGAGPENLPGTEMIHQAACRKKYAQIKGEEAPIPADTV